jgi:pectate lyase
MRYISIILCLLIPILTNSQAFPGAVGFGTNTRGAYSGSSEPAILIVDNLSPDSFGDEKTGRGTFLWAITRKYPRIIMFEVSGIIDFRERASIIDVRNPYMTIAGQTAPDVGITILGHGIFIQYTHDIIIQHLRFRVGNHENGQGYRHRSGIFLWEAENVVIDHCSFSWSLAQIYRDGNYSNGITYSNCIFAEPLHNSEHYDKHNQPKPHGFASLGYGSENITLMNNLTAYSVDRNPLTRNTNVVIINNMNYISLDWSRDNLEVWGRIGPWLDNHGNHWDKLTASIVGNVSLTTEKSREHWSLEISGEISHTVPISSDIYVADNIGPKRIKDPSLPEEEYYLISNGSFKFATESPIDLSEYSILPSSEVEDYILANAGAKPWKRDPTDRRILDQVKNRQGEYINSVYPRYARVYNWWFSTMPSGRMLKGFDWQKNPSSFSINGTNVNLNQKCSDIDAVITYLNTKMPAGVMAYKHYGGEWVGFRTIEEGSQQKITVNGNGLSDFGIKPGTYFGEDGVPDFFYESYQRSITDIPGYPEKPHGEFNKTGFTNLQMWLHEFENFDLQDHLIEYLVDFKVIGNGHLTINGLSETNSFQVNHGTDIVIEAIADEEWEFLYWSYGQISYNPVDTITIEDNLEIVAVFRKSDSESSTGNRNIPNFNINVFPNPARDILNIEINDPDLNPISVRLINLSGKIILERILNPGLSQFPLTHNTQPGTYFIQLMRGGLSIFSQRLVITN